MKVKCGWVAKVLEETPTLYLGYYINGLGHITNTSWCKETLHTIRFPRIPEDYYLQLVKR